MTVKVVTKVEVKLKIKVEVELSHLVLNHFAVTTSDLRVNL